MAIRRHAWRRRSSYCPILHRMRRSTSLPLVYALSDEASPLDTFNELQPVGSATSIADSLITILSDARSESLAAVVLGSDGIDTAGGISADKLAEIAAFGVPIHTIGVGRDAIAEDLELSQVLVARESTPGQHRLGQSLHSPRPIRRSASEDL